MSKKSNFKLEYSIYVRPAKSWIASGCSPSQWLKRFRPNYSKKYLHQPPTVARSWNCLGLFGIEESPQLSSTWRVPFHSTLPKIRKFRMTFYILFPTKLLNKLQFDFSPSLAEKITFGLMFKVIFSGVEGFEPPRWLNQNQLPYHLATPQYLVVTTSILCAEKLLSISYFNLKSEISNSNIIFVIAKYIFFGF